MSDHIHIVSVSSGIPSAVTAIKAVEKYGRDNVLLLFADTQAEDEDNYRFLHDLEVYLDMLILRLSVGKTPMQTMQDQDVIYTQAFAPCTRMLKLEPIYEFVQVLLDAGIGVTMHIGYDFGDKRRGRLESTTRNYEAIGVAVEYLLLEQRVFDPEAELRGYGLEPPRTYAMGFSHANCLGQGGCVKFGQQDMIRVLNLFPERYAYRERVEADIRTHQATWHIVRLLVLAIAQGWNWNALDVSDLPHALYAHVRDTTNDTGYVTLRQLRERYEQAQADDMQLQLFTLNADLSGCSKECGVTDAETWQTWQEQRKVGAA